MNPKDIEFQTAEAVLPNPASDQQTIQSFFNTMVNIQMEKSNMNRLIWGNNLLAMQALLASGYEGKVNLIYIWWMGFWSNVDRSIMRYETFGIITNRGQWKWKKERATIAIENYRKFENEFKNNLGTDQYEKLSKHELEFLKN
jgi:hypothetical protein